MLDPYMGSGTTAVVAIDQGLHFVGYEISKNYISIAHKRIAEARQRRMLIDHQPHNDTSPRYTIPDLFDDEQNIGKS